MRGRGGVVKRNPQKQQNPRELPRGGFDKAGDDLLSRYSHYHGPQVLNGRVRNGNGCGHLGMVTGKTHGVACHLAPGGNP